jgi:hypothetical protein
VVAQSVCNHQDHRLESMSTLQPIRIPLPLRSRCKMRRFSVNILYNSPHRKRVRGSCSWWSAGTLQGHPSPSTRSLVLQYMVSLHPSCSRMQHMDHRHNSSHLHCGLVPVAGSVLAVQSVARTLRHLRHSSRRLAMPRSHSHYRIGRSMTTNEYHMAFQHSIHWYHELVAVTEQESAQQSVVDIPQNRDRLWRTTYIRRPFRTFAPLRSSHSMTRFAVNYRYSTLGLDPVELVLGAS